MTEDEAREWLAYQFQQLGAELLDVVFCEHDGNGGRKVPGVTVYVRAEAEEDRFNAAHAAGNLITASRYTWTSVKTRYVTD